MALATIQQITSIDPIPDADKIEVATVLGWKVVVVKGDFQVGDPCIYIEIDSLLPRKPWSEFLFKHEDEKVYRLRTIKLRKQISQGLILPVGVLNLDPDMFEPKFIGLDVTKELEIGKYEKPTPGVSTFGLGRVRKSGHFPSFIRKTDEVRIQSEPWRIENLKGKSYYITQKLDGTSATYYRYKKHFGVCSRNIELEDPRTPKGFIKNLIRNFKIKVLKYPLPKTNVYWNMVGKYNLDDWLPEGYALQGEICGPTIQGNKLGLTETKFFLFNVWNIDKQEYEFPFGVERGKGLLDYVPTLEIRGEFNYTMDELIEKAKGKYSNDTPQEGIVVRSIDQKISFKVVNNDFLLKYGE